MWERFHSFVLLIYMWINRWDNNWSTDTHRNTFHLLHIVFLLAGFIWKNTFNILCTLHAVYQARFGSASCTNQKSVWPFHCRWKFGGCDCKVWSKGHLCIWCEVSIRFYISIEAYRKKRVSCDKIFHSYWLFFCSWFHGYNYSFALIATWLQLCRLKL